MRSEGLRPRFGRALVNFLILVFWIFLIVDSFVQGLALPLYLGQVALPDLPVFLFVGVAVLGSLGGSSFVFWQRKNLMDEMPVVAERIDGFFGPKTYSHFTRQLRPTWASICSSSILGGAGLYTTLASTQGLWSLAISGGTLLFALFMFLAWLLSLRFPPTLS